MTIFLCTNVENLILANIFLNINFFSFLVSDLSVAQDYDLIYLKS